MDSEVEGFWGGDWNDTGATTPTPKTEIRKKKISHLQSIMAQNERPFRKFLYKLRFWK